MNGSVLQEILYLYPSLPPAERRVADVILTGSPDVLYLTSAELGSLAQTSQTAVSRFCSRLQTKTFASFKIQLAQQLTPPPNQHAEQPITETLPEVLALAHIAQHTEEELTIAQRAVITLDPLALQRSAQAILAASVSVIAGFDLSGSVAWRLASLLHYAGCRARPEQDPYHAPWVNDLSAGDVLLIITYRGTIPSFIEPARRARARGTTLIVLTNESQSEIALLADILLLTRAPAARSDEEYVTGTALYVQLSVARAIWQAVIHLRHP